MIVYKVVRNKNGKLKSAMQRGGGIAQLTYVPGEATVPKFGKIFAFLTIRSAERFVRLACPKPEGEVWEANTPEAEPIKVIASDIFFEIAKRFRKFWSGKYCSFTMEAPEGTVVCPELSLRRMCDNAPVKNSP